MNKTAIEYATHPCNAIVGCSANCHNCWAKAILRRFPHGCPDCAAFRPHFHPEVLEKLAVRTKKPAIVLMNYTGDMFGPEVPQAWRDACFEAMAAAPWHRYLLLTKQPQNITYADQRQFGTLRKWVEDILIGVSADTTEQAHMRLSVLQRTGLRANIWLSMEPLREPLLPSVITHFVNWLVVGPETPLRTARVRPPLAWYETIRDACAERGVPVWFKTAALKQYPEADLPQEWPPELRGER